MPIYHDVNIQVRAILHLQHRLKLILEQVNLDLKAKIAHSPHIYIKLSMKNYIHNSAFHLDLMTLTNKCGVFWSLKHINTWAGTTSFMVGLT